MSAIAETMPRLTTQTGWPIEVADGLSYLRTGIVNVFFVGPPGAGDRGWVLIDAGIAGWTGAIAAAAARRFGPGARPSAIVLTHGHFDHVGALPHLAETWDVPVYAHPLELPYLTGRSSYPPPDPTVGGGAMATLSWLYPRGPIDLDDRAQKLPDNGSVPGLAGWRWIATPGHSPGHVSLFRDADRTLIAGDAFVTTRQESALAVLAQRPELHGPPAYYTCDWQAARRSVRALAELEPRVAATGHGVPLEGEPMRAGLRALAREFDRRAVPAQGRYIRQPARTDARGIISLPPEVWDPRPVIACGFAAGFVAGAVVCALTGPPRRQSE
jgi:glyoxylase-like metal-dependent hydrolase (beta-lactamase superfamily II)